MKTTSALLFLLPAAAFAAELSDTPSPVDSDPAPSLITPAPALPVVEPLEAFDEQLEAREIVQGAAAAQSTGATQANPVTTLWPQTTLADGSVVNYPVTYTQKFSAVPEQWPEPSSGTIGLGTLSGTIGVAHTVKARSVSEGALGQTPWIGMAVGLACTALAAVMLG